MRKNGQERQRERERDIGQTGNLVKLDLATRVQCTWKYQLLPVKRTKPTQFGIPHVFVNAESESEEEVKKEGESKCVCLLHLASETEKRIKFSLTHKKNHEMQ